MILKAYVTTKNSYFIAVLAPILVSLCAWILQPFLSNANISLFYIVAVIFTAVNSTPRSTLFCALLSFLAFNFFFTEPQGSMFVMHTPDVLNVTLFLFIAVVVGHLAAGLKEKLELLQRKEEFSQIELRFMEKLAGAINSEDVIYALSGALNEVANLNYGIFNVISRTVNWDSGKTFLPESLEQRVQEKLLSNDSHGDSWQLQDSGHTAMLLDDGQETLAVLAIRTDSKSIVDSVTLLAHQANVALGRTRLVMNLETEQLEKEQEVMRSSLLSSVSHDFRTPLTSMVGATSTLIELRNTLSEEEQDELLQSVLSEARRLNSYTQKLLDMTRLGRGKLKLNRTTISIEEILNQTIKRVKQIPVHHIIKLDLAPDLPPLNVHPALIEQALFNVIENAIKFSPENSPIAIRSRLAGALMLIEIEDGGPGIPDEEREKVFEMFHSAERGDRRLAGSGLGLAICKGMIGAHGGEVKILDGSAGRGCRLQILLPVGEYR